MQVCAGLPNQVQVMGLHDMHDAAEAEVIGSALADASVSIMLEYRGSVPVAFPTGAQHIIAQHKYNGPEPGHLAISGAESQAGQTLSCPAQHLPPSTTLASSCFMSITSMGTVIQSSARSGADTTGGCVQIKAAELFQRLLGVASLKVLWIVSPSLVRRLLLVSRLTTHCKVGWPACQQQACSHVRE